MINYEKEILNKLIDKYEKSKSFIKQNKVNQNFTISISYLFPEYADHSKFKSFNDINNAVNILENKSFVIAKANSANVYDTVVLNISELDKAYIDINRTPKKHLNISVSNILKDYMDKNKVLSRYCDTQFKRIELNQTVQFCNGSLQDLENILKSVDEILKLKTETFSRDFSVKVFKDSKTFEKIESKVVNLLFEFGDFPEKEQVLGNLNIIKNPTYVNFKGAGSITINGQFIDCSKLKSDIAISSIMLIDIDVITVTGVSVVTVENLTSFHTFHDKQAFAIYLGGYHNQVRRDFIKKLYKQNKHIDFYHFGDIDAGGFYILEHLRNETNVDFKPFKMNVETLKKYSNYTKNLTDNDKKRLLKLCDSPYKETIDYMLANNCKLEQEVLNIELTESHEQ